MVRSTLINSTLRNRLTQDSKFTAKPLCKILGQDEDLFSIKTLAV
jgi:hypothetical protein